MRATMRNSRGARWLAVAALTIPLAVVSASAAQAASGPYDIDGDVPDSADFTMLPDTYGAVKELGPLNSSTTKIGVIHNDAVPTLGLTNPNAQVDLRKAWIDIARDDNDHDWLYFAWERDSNSGSGFIAYEFMHNPVPAACGDYSAGNTALIADCNPWKNRQAGDFMILWDQQGGSRDLYLRTWSGTGSNLTLSAPDKLDATVSEAKYSADGFKGEAAVDLTATVFDGAEGCQSFANTIPSTVTGNSDSADYKDTILTPAPVITNCGSVEITKVTDPAGDDETSFTWTMSRSSGDDINFDGDTSASDTIKDAETDTVTDLISGDDYTLSETDPGPKYATESIECTLGESTYDVDAGDEFPVAAGETTRCTITNKLQPGTLIVNKVVVNDNGGTKTATDFAFQVDGGTAVPFDADGSVSQTVPTGTYDVTEANLPISGYTTTYNNCADVFVPAGGSATCTITNDDQAATLIVKKIVVNDNGGTKKAEDFSFKVNGGSAIVFEADGQNDLTVNAGTYSVVEDGVPIAGYTTTYNNCTNLVIPNGGTATCTITNDDTKASPSGATTQSWVLQDRLNISGLRSGAADAGSASATFRLYSDASCSAASLVGTEVDNSVTAGGVASTTTGIAVTATGDYYWTVQYSGDQYNNGFTTTCGDEISKIRAKDAGRDDLNVN